MTAAAAHNLPRISVLLPVFNAERTIDACLGSVCQSGYPELEICVIDDGSTDGSLQRLQSWRQHDPRIRLHSQGNRGVALTRNALIEMSEGELLVLQDADDVSHRARIETIADSYRADQWDLLHSRAFLINATGEIKAASYLLRPFAYFLRGGHCSIIHGSVAMRRAALDGIGHYRAYPAEDLDLWLRFLNAGASIRFCPKPLYAHRIHGDSVTGRSAKTLHESALALRLHGSVIGFPHDIQAYYSRKIAVTFENGSLLDVVRENPRWAARLYLARGFGRLLARRYRACAEGFDSLLWGL